MLVKLGCMDWKYFTPYYPNQTINFAKNVIE